MIAIGPYDRDRGLDADTVAHGADWYPEQWPESRWEIDAQMMEQAHLNVTRIGEFAWSAMEPSEGHFELDWLDRAIRVLEKHHIAVVLGTPSAAPPAWLTRKYPDVLRIDENGQRVTHGNRAHGSASSPEYRELCQYNALLAERQPGELREALGDRVEQYYALEHEIPLTPHGHASVWAEYLSGNAHVLMRYGTANGWLDGQPAMVTREYGKGRITYIGCVLDASTLDSAAAWMARVSGVHRAFGPVRDSVEVTRRVGTNHKQVFVLINFASRPREVTLPRTMWSVFDKRPMHAVHLTRYGVAVMMSDQR